MAARKEPTGWVQGIASSRSLFLRRKVASSIKASAMFAHKHLFVGTDTRKSHARRINYLRATERRGFWATHGRSPDVAANS